MRVIDLNTLSMVGGSGIAEAKIPLWWADGTTVGTTDTSMTYRLQDGANQSQNTTSSSTNLFKLSSNWPTNLKFAFEATIYINNASTSAYAGLYDITSSTMVTSVNTTSSTATVLRSPQVTLTPNHVYGVIQWSGNSGYTAYISNASLIIFP